MCQPNTVHSVDHSTTHLNDLGCTARKRNHEYQSPRHRNTWSASAQHQSMGSEMSFETLTNIPLPQLRNAAPWVLSWPVVSSPLQSRYLHVLTQLSYVSISSCAECAACPATTTITNVCRIWGTATTDPWNCVYRIVMGWNPNACFETLAPGWYWQTTTRTPLAKLNAWVGAYAKCLQLIRRLLSFDGVGHVLLRHILLFHGHKSSTRCGMLGATLCTNSLFLCEAQSTVREIRTAERLFQAPHAAFNSRREASRFTWSCHRRKPSSQNIQQASKMHGTHVTPWNRRRQSNTRRNVTFLDVSKNPPRSTKTMMMYVITNLARIFCGALHHSIVALEWLAVTLQRAHRRRNRQRLNERTHVVSKAKTSKNVQIQPSSSPRLRRKGLPFHFELWLANHLQNSSCVNPSLECWPIFHMLSHLEPSFRHSFVHLARRCHLGSHFARRIMLRFSYLRDLYYVQTLLSDGRGMPPRFPESWVLESAHRYREGRQLDVPVRSGLRWSATRRREQNTFEKWMLQQSCWIICWPISSVKSGFCKVGGPKLG